MTIQQYVDKIFIFIAAGFITLAGLSFALHVYENYQHRKKQITDDIMFGLDRTQSDLVNAVLLDQKDREHMLLQHFRKRYRLSSIRRINDNELTEVMETEHVPESNLILSSWNKVRIIYQLDSIDIGLGYLVVDRRFANKDLLFPAVKRSAIFSSVLAALFFALLLIMYLSIKRHLVSKLTQMISTLQENSEVLLQGSKAPLKNYEDQDFCELQNLSHQIEIIQNRALKERNQREKSLRETAKFDAILKTTKMFAHDVRRPFSTIKAALTILAGVRSIDELKSTTTKLENEINKSLCRVDEMIDNVMSVGSSQRLKQHPTELSTLIEDALEESFKTSRTANINFEYSFNHLTHVFVDKSKIIRVICNILVNASQAMKQKGSIYFESRQISNQAMVELQIGNTGTFVPEDLRVSIFDAFVTQGKANGTGLGLAIAKEIIQAHGGSIRCESDQSKGTIFVIRLPAASELSVGNSFLPKSVRSVVERYHSRLVLYSEDNDSDIGFEQELARDLVNRPQTLNILIVEDEPIYMDCLTSYLKENTAVAQYVNATTISDPSSESDTIFSQSWDAAIIDVDFGDININGFQLARNIRRMNRHAKICIHSSYGFLDYQTKSRAYGADIFIPKPMTRSHMLRLLAIAC